MSASNGEVKVSGQQRDLMMQANGVSCSVALIRRLISRMNAYDLRGRIIRHIRSEQQPELSDMRIVRGPAQLDARMPMFVTAFLQEQWRQATAKTC